MKTFHWSPRGAGLIFLSLSLPSVAGFYAGKSIDRFGARRPGQMAMSLSGLALFFLRFVQRESMADKALLTGSLAVVGLGITILQIIAMTEVFEVIGDSEAESPGIFGDTSPMAQGYALFNMAFAAGQLFGPLLAGFLRVHAGWNGMTLIFGIICALAVAPITIFSGTRCTATEGKSGDEHVEAGST
jgi:MFS family permease